MASELERKAYIIGGHGSEDEETFIVPYGCTIVAKAYSGSFIKAYTTLEQELCSLSPSILKNPIEYYTTLFESFGSLAIYQSGQICPNFKYALQACYQEKNEWCDSFGSGVLDVDKIYEDPTYIRCVQHIGSYVRREKNRNAYQAISQKSINASTYEYIMNLYKHSVLPTPETIGNLIDDLHDSGKDTLSEIIKGINKDVSYTQNDLCNRFPGVYYNFVCRYSPGGKIVYNYNNNTNSYYVSPHISLYKRDYQKELEKAEEELQDTIETYFTKEQANPNNQSLPEMYSKIKQLQRYITQLQANPKNISRVLQGHISNSLYRKPYIKKMYENRVKGGKTRRASHRKRHHRRKTRRM